MATVADVGISMKEVTDGLLAEGVRLFTDAFEKVLGAVESKAGRRAREGPTA